MNIDAYLKTGSLSNTPAVGEVQPKDNYFAVDVHRATVYGALLLWEDARMFKHTEDEVRFNVALDAFIAEFGGDNLIVYLPKRVSDCIDVARLKDPVTVKYWRKNLYSIRCKEFTAGFDLAPID